MKFGFYICRVPVTHTLGQIQTEVCFNTRYDAENRVNEYNKVKDGYTYFVVKYGTGLVIHEIDGRFYIFNLHQEKYFSYNFLNRDNAVRTMNNLFDSYKTDNSYCDRHYTIASPNE